MVYDGMGEAGFSLTNYNAGDPVTHEFGTAVVTMPDKEGSFIARGMLSDVVYVSFSLLCTVDLPAHGHR